MLPSLLQRLRLSVAHISLSPLQKKKSIKKLIIKTELYYFILKYIIWTELYLNIKKDFLNEHKIANVHANIHVIIIG